MTSILQDLLDPSLLANEPRIIVQQATDLIIHKASEGFSPPPRSKSAGAAKSLLEFQDLVRQAIDDYEKRSNTSAQSKVIYTAEEPEVTSETETITYSLIKRQPGGFGRGAPFESNVRNLRPIIREVADDPCNPSYRTIVLGYLHENVVRFTCWARTNKAANARALWFENLMEDYTWWFILQGVNRVIYWGQGSDMVVNINNNRWYGRPIDYYVKTETLRNYSEKTLEEILINLDVAQE